MVVGSLSERPVILAVCRCNGQIVDARHSTAHQSVLVELPVFIAVGSEPVSRIIVEFIGETHGNAIAGGCILACAADRRLMARGSGRIGIPELLVGVAFPPVPLEIVRFSVNPAAAADLLFNGPTLAADAAVNAGLVDVAVDSDALAAEALAAAEAMASRPGEAFAITKQQFRAPALQRMRDGRRQLDRRIEEIWCSASTLDRIRHYIARTFKKPDR